MKINILSIILDHLATLRSEHCEDISARDIFLFYIFPIFPTWIICAYIDVNVEEFFGMFISVSAIFGALLLNVQVSIFSIFTRPWARQKDRISNNRLKKAEIQKKALVRELNANISYSILMCMLFILVFVLLLLPIVNPILRNFAVIYMSIHIFLNIFLILKRSHALFSKEYSV